MVVGVVAVVLTLTGAGPARADTVLAFDDLPAFQQVGEGYAALGVHFARTDFGVQVGLANGDPGNWGVNGTNGPYFEGFNGSPSYSMTVTLDAPVSGLSLDVSRTNGSQPGDTFTLSVFNGATLLDTQTVVLGQINS
jgi:hypothetical protein